MNNICPYTGLRSFTEDESIYFKGRDHQIDQLTALLEKNKFLMVTGASGEGKSSLIYAGLIPNARAGFFKAKYTNLMIIVDQFEEFFTNPENFYKEAPSQDSQIVVNLILETARIALKKNIPVYVVCTMRSDYIGQCSAFRGLPEYIGFSQFFVPRLKRKDLKQVVEEPAILSGNRIS